MYNVNDFKIGVIYMYVSPNGKRYIGQTIDERNRKAKHKRDSKTLKTHFANAIRKYGFENFEYKILIKFKPTLDREKLKRVLDKLEQRYIKIYNTYDSRFGYNLNKGGNGNRGYKHSEEMIEYLKTCSKTEDQIKNLELGRKTHSEETKKKISQSKKKGSKIVQKCDLEGNVLEEYDSIIDAARSFEDNHKTRAKRIGECCNGKSKTIYSFIWRYKNF